MGCQEGSMIPSHSHTSSSGATAAASPVPPACAGKSRRRRKMNVIMEAVVFGVLFLTRPAYPHPVSCPPCSRSGGEIGSGKGEEGEDHSRVAKSNVPRLPSELYSIIAYHLQYDTPSSKQETLLNSCSLVSSAWLVASRMYTFRTVRLTYKTVYGFLRLLEDSRCSFKWCVRRLEMREGEYAVDRWMDDVLPRLVLDGTGMMQRVEVLDLYNLTWAELSKEAVVAFKKGFATFGYRDEESVGSERGKVVTMMKSLRVGTCYWECVHDFVGFVCSPAFVGLKTLVCDSVLLNCGIGSCQCRDADDVEIGPVLPPEFSRVLERLYLGLPEENMLKWFIKEDGVSGIEKLGLVVRERALMELVGQLVGRVTQVKELALDLPSGCGLSLVNNTQLKSLRVNVDLSLFSSASPFLAANPSIDTLAWLLDLISSIPSPYFHLLILHLDLTMISIGNFRSLWPWRDFINVINGLESVQRVLFIVTYSRRRAFDILKEVIREKTLVGNDVVRGCKVRVRGVRFNPERDLGSELWKRWIED